MRVDALTLFLPFEQPLEQSGALFRLGLFVALHAHDRGVVHVDWRDALEDRPEGILVQDGGVMILYPVTQVTPPAYVHRVAQGISEGLLAQAVPAVRFRLLGRVEEARQMRWNGRKEIDPLELPRKFVEVEIEFDIARGQPFAHHLRVRCAC